MHDSLNGYELISNDDTWYVIHEWYQGVCTTKLIDKEYHTIQDALDWIRDNENSKS